MTGPPRTTAAAPRCWRRLSLWVLLGLLAAAVVVLSLPPFVFALFSRVGCPG